MSNRSSEIFKKAQAIFPGGVNSPVRAFKSVKKTPFIVEKGEGAYLTDVDGNSYIDFVCSWGPLVLGHANEEVVAAITEQLSKGTSYGATCELEVTLGNLIKKYYPSMEMLRFVNSGTEAAMSILRLARGFTGNNKIIKFSGCYHGHVDSLLVQAGSGLATLSLPGSAGVPEHFVKDTLISQFNNLESVEKHFEENKNQICAIILEPIMGNAGFIKPKDNFLKSLRELCDKNNALLIFDEVMTGFRVAPGGAQEIYDVKPDLTMLGKVVGGGLPVGVFGGRKEIMEHLAPIGAVYQAGTLSGNPLAMSAGLATLKNWVENDNFSKTQKFTQSLVQAFREFSNDHSMQVDSEGTMFGIFFGEEPVESFEDALKTDTEKFINFFDLALKNGLYFAPSPYEAGFLSVSHDNEVMEKTYKKLEEVFSSL